MISESKASVMPVLLEQLRLLKSNEQVQRGDFVANPRHGFELWEGPSGFRADTFVRQTYRLLAPARTKRAS